jgi:uncharacterized protein (TIGR02246 family)
MPGEDGASEVRDALAIRALCERYAQAVDAGDSAAFVSLFTPDGHLVSNYTGSSSEWRDDGLDWNLRWR